MSLLIRGERIYSGGFRTEIEAARIYDIISLKKLGLKVSNENLILFRQGLI